LNENRETEALAARNHLDIGRLNEVMVIFTRFTKCVEGNPISYFDIFPMLQNLLIKLGSLHANKHAETLTHVVSGRFSPTMNLKVIFVCCLVTPVGKNTTVVFSDQGRPRQAWKQCGDRAS
jgi:epoxyqueuosine reductase QueG